MFNIAIGAGVLMLVLLGFYFLMFWRIERRREYGLKERQAELDRIRIEAELEEKKKEREEKEKEREERKWREYKKEKLDEEESIRRSAGAGTGGYIVVDLPNEQRPFFHDLLKGFEEFARLKGYSIAFSIDSTFKDKIVFKFTLDQDVFNVSTEKVRKDFKEYIDKVRSGDNFDDIPVITSLEEHELLLTVLKNRINFLQHSYQLKKNALASYERLLERFLSAPLLTSPNVLVQTGGSMDSRSYSSINSLRSIQGDHSTFIEDSTSIQIKIGKSFNQRQEQITSLEKLIQLLSKETMLSETNRNEATRELSKVTDELKDEEQPDRSRLKKWLERAKNILDIAKLSKDAAELAKIVFECFGLGMPGS